MRPAVEVIQNKDNYKVRVQLPGVKKDNIEVELDNDFTDNYCSYSRRKEEKQEAELIMPDTTLQNSVMVNTRELFLSDQPIKTEEAKAKYKDGVLCITIPKQNIEATKPKKISYRNS